MMKDNKNSGLALVMSRNAFYRDAYKRVVLVLVLLFVLNCGLASAILYEYFTPPAPQYFATNAQGVIIESHPQSDPVLSDGKVLQWTSAAIRTAFRTDFVHWRKQLQDASGDFTPQGWRYFLSALKSSGNLDALLNMKMVSDATITATPQILAESVIDGQYVWKINMPLLITYTDGKSQTSNTPLNVTVLVTRVPVKDYPEGIAINNFLPDVRKTEQ